MNAPSFIYYFIPVCVSPVPTSSSLQLVSCAIIDNISCGDESRLFIDLQIILEVIYLFF